MILEGLITYLFLATAPFTCLAAPNILFEGQTALAQQPYTTSPNLKEPVTHTLSSAGAYHVRRAGTFKSITATLVAPEPTGPDGSATAWIGIDGMSCRSAELRIGIKMHIIDGAVFYDAWYQWYPEDYNDLHIRIAAGDVLKLTVNATSDTSGMIAFENLTQYQEKRRFYTSKNALCGEVVRWIVGDYWENGDMVPLCNFGTVNFTSAEAVTSAGKYVGPSGGGIFDIYQHGKVLTKATVYSSAVAIEYV